MNPSVVIRPSIRGVRVISGERGGEELIGTLFPWHRVRFISHQGGTNTQLQGEDGQMLKIRNRIIWTKLENRANAAQRAQYRHICNWVDNSCEPIRFVPREQSPWAALTLSGLMAIAICYLLIRILMQFQHFPPQVPADWFALAQLSVLLICTAFFSWFLWTYRPRKQEFTSVDLLPTGIVGTRISGEVVSVEFNTSTDPKLRKGDPLRLELTIADGRRMSIAVPKPISSYLCTALNPPTESQAEVRRASTKRMFWLGLRIILLGPIIAAGAYFFVGWMGQVRWILPQDAAVIQQKTPFLAGYPLIVGASLLFVSWKHSDHGMRTCKRLAQRFKQRQKRESESKDRSSTTR